MNRKKNEFQDEIAAYDDHISKKQQKIEKLVDSYQSLNIKTTMLGQDKDMNEYWLFKDEPSRLFIKKADDSDMSWHYINEEEEFDQLFESLNIKGIKEKKLQETLKKVRQTLKMKKAKKPSAQKLQEDDEDEEMADESKPVEKDDDEVDLNVEGEDRHHLFENDNFEQTIVNAVWYNKQMPKRRKNADAIIRTRHYKASVEEYEQKETP